VVVILESNPFPGLSNNYGITKSARLVYEMFLTNVAVLVNLYEIK